VIGKESAPGVGADNIDALLASLQSEVDSALAKKSSKTLFGKGQ